MTPPSLLSAVDSQQDFAAVIARLLNEEFAGAACSETVPTLLRRYYANLLDRSGCIVPLAVFAYVQRLWPLVLTLSSSGRPLHVLDAGCGYGTEAFIMALLGAEVTAVDLQPEKIAVCEARRPFYESRAGIPLRLQFKSSNVLRLLNEVHGIDAIWVMEALSHIHPPFEFLQLSYDALREDGILFVSDPNKTNPLAFWRSVALRGSLRHKIHQRFVDPETGLRVPYGQEHISSSFRMAAAVKRTGFVIENIAMSGFMGTTLLPDWALRNHVTSRAIAVLGLTAALTPLVRNFGTVYTVVARRPWSS